MNEIIYKLYEENRCRGNQELHENNLKTYISQNENMLNLITYIREDGDKSKSYYILKYIDDDLRWRQLGKKSKLSWSTFEKGDLTTTWSRFFYDNKTDIWRETNYRYKDELIYSKST